MTTLQYMPPTFFDIFISDYPSYYSLIKEDAQTLTVYSAQHPVTKVKDMPNYDQYWHLIIESIKRDNYGTLPDDDNERLNVLLHKAQQNYIDILNFELFGKHPFYVTDNLADHLINTELNADASFLHLPFPSCAFVYTSPWMIDAAYEAIGVDKEMPKGPYLAPITVFLHESPLPNHQYEFWITARHCDREHLYLTFDRHIITTANYTVADLLKEDWNSLAGIMTTSNGTTAYDSGRNESPAEAAPFFRAVINTILYLVSSEPDTIKCLSPVKELATGLHRLKNVAKKRKLQSKIGRFSELDYTIVGSHIPKTLSTPAESSDTEDTQKTQRKIMARFVVMGHWRNQPYGEHRGKIKLIWIKPYYKGPEITDIVSKPYLVK